MEKIKKLFENNFEILLVFSLFVAIGLIHYFVSNKLVFLNFYFLPTLVSGFYLGRRSSMATGLLSIALVCYFIYLSPESYAGSQGGKHLAWNLMAWASFLMLTSIVVGTLYEQNRKKKSELKETYDGVLEILSKFIEAIDRYTKGHSVRVSEMSVKIGRKLGLSEERLESLRIAGLLHDIGKIEVSTNVIMKAAKLTDAEISEIQKHPEKGAEILSPFRSIFRDVVSIVLSHHHYFDGSGYGPKPNDELAMSTDILAVADAFDSMTSDRPYRQGKPPWVALEIIRKTAGQQFNPTVVRAFESVFREKFQTEQEDAQVENLLSFVSQN